MRERDSHKTSITPPSELILGCPTTCSTLHLAILFFLYCIGQRREKHVRERLSLESSLDSMQDELQSAHKKLDYEARWRDSAQSTHKKLLQEKAELQSRLASRFHCP